MFLPLSGQLLAQAQQGTGGNPFALLETFINSAVSEGVNLIFAAPAYQAWVWLRLVIAVYLAFNTFVWRWIIAMLAKQQKEGMFLNVLIQGLWINFVFLLVFNPAVICEPIFSLFAFLNALGDQLIYSTLGGDSGVLGQLQGIVDGVQGSSYVWGFSFGWLLGWLLAALCFGALTVAYYFHYASGVAFLYIVFPFFMGMAIAGLLSKPTQGWFGSTLNLGLSQALKPLIGKVFLFITLFILKVAVVAAGGFNPPSGKGVLDPVLNPVYSFIDRTALILIVFIVVSALGVALQFQVGTAARFFTVTVFQGAKDLYGSGIAGGAIALTLGALRLAAAPFTRRSRGSNPVRSTTGDEIPKISREPNAFDKQVVGGLRNSDGFKGLNREEQNKFLRYVGGKNEQLSQSARDRLAGKIERNNFNADSPEAYRDFLREQPGADPLATPSGTFDGRREEFEVGAAEDIGKYKFAGGSRVDAERYNVDVNGQSVGVVVPKDLDPRNGDFASVDQVANALAAVPDGYRDRIKQVEISPTADKGDFDIAGEFGKKKFQNFSNTKENGTVQLFPSEKPVTQSQVDGSLIGSAGNLLAADEFKNNPSSLEAYKNAIRDDLITPSGYAKYSPQRDFSETVKLFEQVRGTPQEAEVRRLLEERLRVIQEIRDRQDFDKRVG
jgi:hypothetical protein